jgi:hypothetical protein
MLEDFLSIVSKKVTAFTIPRALTCMACNACIYGWFGVLRNTQERGSVCVGYSRLL